MLVFVLALTLLAVFHGLIFANFIGDSASTCAGRATYQCTFSTACECADYGSSGCGTTDDFRACVISVVLLGLFTLCAIVLGLSDLMKHSVFLCRNSEGR
jgi:hypothetical protein